MCKFWSRVRIWIRNGIKMESRILIRIGMQNDVDPQHCQIHTLFSVWKTVKLSHYFAQCFGYKIYE